MPILGIIASSKPGTVIYKTLVGNVIGTVFGSTDNITWNYLSNNMSYLSTGVGFASGAFTRLSFANGKFYFPTAGDVYYESTDGTTWTKSSTSDGRLRNIIYENGQYVGIRNSDYQIETSPNGINWTSQLFPDQSVGSANDIAYGNGVYATANSGYVLTSTDAVTWTSRTVSANVDYYTGIIYAGGKWVVVGYENALGNENGRIYTSTDAITWTQRTPATGSTNARPIKSIAYGNGYYLAPTGYIMGQISTDAITWTLPTFPGIIPGVDGQKAAYGNGQYVFVGGWDTFYTSTNTTTWTSRSPFAGASFGGLAYGNSVWVFGSEGTIGSSNTPIFTSTNLVTYTERGPLNEVATSIRTLTYGNNLYLAAGAASLLKTSTNLTTWTSRTMPVGSITFVNSKYKTGVYVVVGGSGTINSSTDGITWTSRVSQFGTSAVQDVAVGNGVFVAVGSADKASSSTDGVTWTTRTITSSGTTLTKVVFGNGIFLVTGSPDVAASSTDGTTWTLLSATPATINRMTFGNGIFVGCGNSTRTAYTSTNGVAWTTRTLPNAGSNLTINTTAYSNGEYLLFGNGNISTVYPGVFNPIFASTDSITWTSRQSNKFPFSTGIFSAIDI